MPRISVIVPVYNAEKYLNECLHSLANQTMKDIEIIVVNDGSNDTSLDIMSQFADLYKGKFRIIDSVNGGAGTARNKGLDIAVGEFIKFVDADDYLKLNILDTMYNIAKEHKVSLVRGNYTNIIGPLKLEDRNKSLGHLAGNQLLTINEHKDYIISETPSVGNKLISRELLGDLKFPEKTKWEDLAIIPVVVASSEKLFHLDEPVYNYRFNMNTTITDFIKKIPNILDVIKCLEIMKEKMTERGLNEDYQTQIKSLYILHTLYRVENAMLWVNFPKAKKDIVINSLINILDMKYPDWRNNEVANKYMAINPLFKFNLTRSEAYNQNYDVLDNEQEIIENINKTMR